MNNMNFKEQWWLMYCDLPDLNWACLRIYEDKSAQVFDSDGSLFDFENQEDAISFLSEDEFISFEDLDQNHEKDFGIFIGNIKPPQGKTYEEFSSQMRQNIS